MTNPSRITCGEAREKLPLYVGGDLDGDALESVRGHLELCRECAGRAGAAARARRELVAALRAGEADSSRPELWPGIRAALRAEGLIHEGGKPLSLPAAPSRARRWTLVLAPAAAAAVLLAAVQLSGVFSRGRSMPAPHDVTPPIADVDATPISTGGLQKVPPGQVRPRRVFFPGPAEGRESLEGEPGADVSLTSLPSPYK